MTTTQATSLNDLVTSSGLRQSDTLEYDAFRGPAADATTKVQAVLEESNAHAEAIEKDGGLNAVGKRERLHEKRQEAAEQVEKIIGQKVKYLDDLKADGTFDLSTTTALPKSMPESVLARSLEAIREHLRHVDPVERPDLIRQAVAQGDEDGRLVLIAVATDPLRALGHKLVKDDELDGLKEAFVRASNPTLAEGVDAAAEVRRFLAEQRAEARKVLGAKDNQPHRVQSA